MKAKPFKPGDRVGYIAVIAQDGDWVGSELTAYRVRLTCCQRVKTLTHNALLLLKSRKTTACRQCWKAIRFGYEPAKGQPEAVKSVSVEPPLFRAVRRATIAQPNGSGVWVGREWWPSIQGPMGSRHGMTGRY